MTESSSIGFHTLAGESGRARKLRWLFTGALFLFLVSAFVSIAVNSIALGIVAAAWLGLMIISKDPRIPSTSLDRVFLAYCAVEILASIFSLEPAHSFANAKRLLLIGIVYALAANVRTRGDLGKVLGVLLGAGVAVSLVGVAKVIHLSTNDQARLGIFQFYMTTSAQMMVVALLLLPFIVHRGTPRAFRWVAVGAVVPVVVSLYATVTRGAYLAFLAGALVVVLIRNKKLLVPLILSIVIVFLAAPPYIQSRITSIVDIHHPENEHRLMIWSAGLRIAADYPLLGVGDIDLGDLLRTYASPGYPGIWGHVHNTFLQFLVTLGIIGLVVVTLMFVKILVEEWRVYRSVREDWLLGSTVLGGIAVMVGIQTQGLVEWSFGDQEVAILLWLTVGLALAAGRIARDLAADRSS